MYTVSQSNMKFDHSFYFSIIFIEANWLGVHNIKLSCRKNRFKSHFVHLFLVNPDKIILLYLKSIFAGDSLGLN